MAVSTTIAVIEYALDGVTAVYSVPYVFFDADHLLVTYGDVGTETTLTRGADYTVAARPASLPATGSITLLDPASLTGVLRIRRVTPRTQALAQTQTGAQDAAAQVRAWDRLTLIAQELDQEIDDGQVVVGEFVHGNLAGGDLHDLATDSTAGFLSAAQNAIVNDAVTLSDAQTITGQKTIEISDGHNQALLFDASGQTTGAGNMAIFYRRNDSGGALPTGWDVGAFINSQGAWHSNAYLVISGSLETAADGDGVYYPARASGNPAVQGDTGDNAMVSIRSDVAGPALEVRSLSDSTAHFFVGINDSGLKKIVIENDGQISWGNDPTAAGADAHLWRTAAAALRTDASLYVEGRIDAALKISTAGIYDSNLNERITLTTGTGATTLKSYATDGGGVFAHVVDTSSAYATGGLVSFKNNGTQKNSIDKDGKLLSVALQTPITITGPVGSTLATNSIATALATMGLATNSTTGALAAPTYSASIDLDAGASSAFIITATNGSAFTINAPTGMGTGQTITVRIRNTSGGALGTATWDAVFKMDTWVQPADTTSRAITFQWNATNWVEVSRTTADVPN